MVKNPIVSVISESWATMGDSAVLEVSLADDDGASESSGDASAGSLHDLEAPPLLMRPECDIAIQVDAPMKQFTTMETYVTYRVRCTCARWPPAPPVRRRYNHFKALRAALVAEHPLTPVPPVPPLHSARQQLDRYSASFVALRTHALHAFLDRVARHPILTHSPSLRLFVTADEGTLERALKPPGGALRALSGALSALTPVSQPVTTVRVKEREFTAVSDYLQSLRHKLTSLAAITTALLEESRSLARHLESMKPACDAWCSHERGPLALGVQGAGAGYGAAGAARAAAGGAAARALLPHLAAYAAVVHDKLRERDALHNACLANGVADDMQNKLDQLSESLRSEVSDWMLNTRQDIKSHLLDIADKQLLIQQRTLQGWENALQLCRERPADIDRMFKTVSKAALQHGGQNGGQHGGQHGGQNGGSDASNATNGDPFNANLSRSEQGSEDTDRLENISLDVSCSDSETDPLNAMSDLHLSNS